MDERCELTDMLTDQCNHCRMAAALVEAPVWRALYPGGCAVCGVAFEVGVWLTWTATGEVQHSHHK